MSLSKHYLKKFIREQVLLENPRGFDFSQSHDDSRNFTDAMKAFANLIVKNLSERQDVRAALNKVNDEKKKKETLVGRTREFLGISRNISPPMDIKQIFDDFIKNNLKTDKQFEELGEKIFKARNVQHATDSLATYLWLSGKEMLEMLGIKPAEADKAMKVLATKVAAHFRPTNG